MPKAKAKTSPKLGESDHFEMRYNLNLRTHCIKIDESFVDYLLDSERGNFLVYFDLALYEPP